MLNLSKVSIMNHLSLLIIATLLAIQANTAHSPFSTLIEYEAKQRASA